MSVNIYHYLHRHELLPDRLLLHRFDKILIGYKDSSIIDYVAIINNFGSHDLDEFVENFSLISDCEIIIGEYFEIIINSFKISLNVDNGRIMIQDVDVVEIPNVHEAVNVFIELLRQMERNKLFISIGNMFIVEEFKNIINYNFNIYKTSPRIIIAIHALQKIFQTVTPEKYYTLIVPKTIITDNILVITMKFSNNYKIILKFRVNGNITLHGAKCEEDVKLAYHLIHGVLYNNWSEVIILLPLPDI